MTTPTEEPASFEEALAELEDVLRRLEDGSTGLEESLACYERGVGLLKRCYGQLREAEQRIILLTGTDDDGRPLLQPFEHVAAAEIDRPDGKRPPLRPRPG
jgi:exodeoxyribonuclease VII small subunit